MKKTYINPELEVVKLQTMQMMATSSLSLNDNPSDIVDDASEILAPGVDDFDFGMDEVFDMGTEESISNFE